MSLKRGLESLPADRETQTCVRELLLALERHCGEWLEVSQVARMSGVGERCAGTTLPVLARAGVVSAKTDPAAYRYDPDRLLRLEVAGFLRRADFRTGKLQDNVSRFRQRFGR